MQSIEIVTAVSIIDTWNEVVILNEIKKPCTVAVHLTWTSWFVLSNSWPRVRGCTVCTHVPCATSLTVCSGVNWWLDHHSWTPPLCGCGDCFEASTTNCRMLSWCEISYQFMGYGRFCSHYCILKPMGGELCIYVCLSVCLCVCVCVCVVKYSATKWRYQFDI